MDSLPAELWDIIRLYSILDLKDWSSLRLTCKTIQQHTTPIRFGTIKTSFSTKGIKDLEHISSVESLSSRVRVWESYGVQRLFNFEDLDTWTTAVTLAYDSQCVEGTDQGNRDAFFMSRGEWTELSVDAKTALYSEYESERIKADEEVRKLVEDLQTNDRLMKTLEKFPGLTEFAHCPTVFEEERFITRWKRLRIKTKGWDDYMMHENACGEDEDVEALHASCILHALGRARNSLQALGKLTLHVGGPGFLSASRLRCLSIEKDHRMIRNLREEYRAEQEMNGELGSVAAKADKAVERSFEESFKSSIPEYTKMLRIMHDVFEHIKHLEISVFEDDKIGGLSTVTSPLGDLLCHAKNVQKVSLLVGAEEYGHLRPPYSPEYYDDRTDDLLHRLTDYKPWPQLRTLRLSIVTDASTLLKFLRSLAGTLEDLTLGNVPLIPGDDDKGEGSWDCIRPKIAQQLPKLKSLDFVCVSHYPTAGSGPKAWSDKQGGSC
jgi:hypothetical protein